MQKGIAVITLLCALFTASLSLANDELTKTTHKLLEAFFYSASQGSAGNTAELITPEFQMLLSDGRGFDHDGMLAFDAKELNLATDFAFAKLVATTADDIIVARYLAKVDETISGHPTKKWAPRLTVFRKVGGQWKVVSHALFGVGK